VQTYRQAANLWSTAPPSISPAPSDSARTTQLLLQDLDYSYDVVGNPTEIRDWRTPEEWPAGAKPTTRRMEYDDLYRVSRVDYEYPGGYDKFTSPYAPELSGQTDSRRGVPRGHKLVSTRPLWQTYKYDWLGNTASTDDDLHDFYERSLGAVTNNTAQSKPYQITAASQPSSTGPHNGSFSGSTYDAGGNLLGFTLTQTATACTTSLSACTSRLVYTWDEVGRLTTAKRVEGSGSTAQGPVLDYAYDANDERVLKQYYFTSSSGNTPKLTTAYIFDSLELRRTPFDTVTKQYTVDSTTEVAYLSANGMRLARLHYEPPAKGEPKLVTAPTLHSKDLHVFLELPDHLGSESLTIDYESGELVEARTYQPYGATESDYRPDRWKGFREDYGFTGKEEDIEIGLQYFGKRYLSPYLGRWISADPLAVHGIGKGGLNLYAYVDGKLLIVIDRVGLDWTWAQVGHTLNPLPSGRFAQYLAHGDFPTLQSEAAMTKIQNGVIAATVGAEAAIVTGGLAGAAGAGFWGTAAAAGVGYGAGERAQSAALEGATPKQQLQAAVPSAQQVATDAVVGMGTAAGAELLGPAVRAVGKGAVPKWLAEFMKRDTASPPAPASAPQVGDPVYRVWGGDARPNGTFWTRTNPNEVPDYRKSASLPDENTGEWLSEGILKDTSGVEVTPGGATALRPGEGGVDELKVTDPSKSIEVTDVNKADFKKQD
jgi:RHS repeat-associated protein